MRNGKSIFTIISLPILFLSWLSLIILIPHEGRQFFVFLGNTIKEVHPAIGIPIGFTCAVTIYVLFILSFASVIRLSFWLGGPKNYKALRQFEIAIH